MFNQCRYGTWHGLLYFQVQTSLMCPSTDIIDVNDFHGASFSLIRTDPKVTVTYLLSLSFG